MRQQRVLNVGSDTRRSMFLQTNAEVMTVSCYNSVLTTASELANRRSLGCHWQMVVTNRLCFISTLFLIGVGGCFVLLVDRFSQQIIDVCAVHDRCHQVLQNCRWSSVTSVICLRNKSHGTCHHLAFFVQSQLDPVTLILDPIPSAIMCIWSLA